MRDHGTHNDRCRRVVRIFLTGGTGFIGQALVRAMRQRGWAIHALVRDARAAPAR